MATTQKIRYSDCDPQGIVFNGNYARYWDDALTDWLEAAGFGGEELGGIGADMVTAHLEIDFQAPVRLGDTVETSVAIEHIGNTSARVAFESRRLSDATVAASGHEIVVFVDPHDYRPIPVPDEVRALGPGNPGPAV